MKKFIIPLIVVSVMVAVALVGCAPGAAPAPAPGPEPAGEIPTAPNGTPLWRADLAMDYGEPFAFKPDGSPYKVATSYILLGCEEMVNYEGVVRTNVGRAGGVYSMFDANFNADAQVGYLEDLAAVGDVDVLLLHAVNELALAPPVDKCTQAGIQVYAFDPPCYSENVISYVHHWFEGDVGSGICGNKWVEIAEQTGEHLTILEIWGDRAAMWSQGRHQGHYNAIEPLINSGQITLIESSDCLGSEEKTAEFVIDNLTAHPEINGIYHQCGGQNGIIAGLKTLGKLEMRGEPGHVIINTFEGSTIITGMFKEGTIDYVSTHGPWDVCDTICKVWLWGTVCGVDMPKDIVAPMFLLSADNINNANNYMFGALYWSEQLPAQWEKWPILDTETPNTWGLAAGEGPLYVLPENIRGFYYGDYSSWGLRAPSIEDRKANAGY